MALQREGVLLNIVFCVFTFIAFDSNPGALSPRGVVTLECRTKQHVSGGLFLLPNKPWCGLTALIQYMKPAVDFG